MFRRSAAKLDEELGDSVEVIINATKPRRGAFVVTVDGQPALTLENMKRPFTKLRETDLEELALEILG